MIKISAEEYTEGKGKQKHPQEHRAGLMLLGRILKEEYGIESWRLEKDECGKPFLASRPDIFISISHSRGLAVCGVGDRPLGVDVERIRPYKENVWKKVLSPEEQDIFENPLLSKRARQELFYKFWTLKESYMKATGCGFRISPQEITLIPDPDGKILSCPEGYRFQVKKAGADYMIASCEKI